MRTDCSLTISRSIPGWVSVCPMQNPMDAYPPDAPLLDTDLLPPDADTPTLDADPPWMQIPPAYDQWCTLRSHPPSSQDRRNDTRFENITFPQLLLRAVKSLCCYKIREYVKPIRQKLKLSS